MKLWYAVWLDAEVKISHTFTEVAQKVAHQFLLKQLCYLKYPKSLGYFWKKICHSDVSWIAQFGRTGGRCRTMSIKIQPAALQVNNQFHFSRFFLLKPVLTASFNFTLNTLWKDAIFVFTKQISVTRLAKLDQFGNFKGSIWTWLLMLLGKYW